MSFVVGSGDDRSSFERGVEIDLNEPLSMCIAVREARVVHKEKLQAGRLYDEGHALRRKLVDAEGVRTQVFVPLLSGGVAFENMTLCRKEQKPFSDDEIALVETFAEQAVIAIENVRQFREVQPRLEREKATSEVLGVFSQSRDDERPVFDTVLRNAQRLCNSDSAALLLGRPRDQHMTLAALLMSFGSVAGGKIENTITKIHNVPMKMDPNVLVAARAICSGEMAHIAKLTDTQSY